MEKEPKTTAELITLKNGPTLPQEAIALAIDLEGRGFSMRDDRGTLRLSGADPKLLSAEDREQIKKWKLHLLAVVAYCESGVVDSA